MLKLLREGNLMPLLFLILLPFAIIFNVAKRYK
jgi:hypothetical protein